MKIRGKSKLLYPIITAIAVIVAVLSFLWGQGILNRPKISVSCGAIDYKIPVQYEMELFTLRMLLSADELQKQIPDKISASLREYGFPEDRIKLLLTQIGKKENQALPSKIDWKPYEQNIIKVALSKLTSELFPTLLQKYMKIPEGALFFEIDNGGRGSANNTHIVIRLDGTAYQKPLIESDDKLLNSVTEGSELSFDYGRIAPKSKIRGIIWYSHIKDIKAADAVRENEISVSFDQGTVRKKFKENEFFISGSKDNK